MHTATRRYGWLWFAVGDVISKASTFVVLSQVSRHFAAAQAEAFVLVQTAVSLLIAAGDLGFRALGMRHVALTDDLQTVRELGDAVQKRRILAAMFVGLPVVAGAVFSLADTWNTRGLLVYLSLCWMPYFLGYDWALLALRDYERLTWSRVAHVLIVLCSVACALYFDQGIWVVGLGYAGGYIAANAVASRGMPAPTHTRREGVEAASILSWRASFTLALAFAANAFFYSEEVLLTGFFHGPQDAARFGAASRLISTICSIGWLATQYLSPVIAKQKGEPGARKFALAAPLLAWGVAATLATMLLADLICQIVYGDAFSGASETLRQLGPVVLLDAATSFLGTVLVMQGHNRAAVVSLGVAVMCSACTFVLAQQLSLGSAANVPVWAKYSGYVCLLVVQARYAFFGAKERSAA